MTTGELIAKDQGPKWFSLTQLLESVLADVICADANFQLTQAKAWRDFGESLSEFKQIPAVDRVDLSVGFGRLENLGIQELSISLPLEMYQPSWFKRVWWGIIRVFGVKQPPQQERFRLCNANNPGLLALQVKAVRDQNGRWTVDKSSVDDN